MRNLKMVTVAALSTLVFLLSACAPGPVQPREVHKSLYLGKRWMKFVVDNGPSYRDVKLRNGSTIHYWHSDVGDLIAISMGRDDNYPDYCELALKTDKTGIVRKIYVLEESIGCGGVLK
ncbi:hypothetical protein [Nitratifractor sp.]